MEDLPNIIHKVLALGQVTHLVLGKRGWKKRDFPCGLANLVPAFSFIICLNRVSGSTEWGSDLNRLDDSCLLSLLSFHLLLSLWEISCAAAAAVYYLSLELSASAIPVLLPRGGLRSEADILELWHQVPQGDQKEKWCRIACGSSGDGWLRTSKLDAGVGFGSMNQRPWMGVEVGWMERHQVWRRDLLGGGGGKKPEMVCLGAKDLTDLDPLELKCSGLENQYSEQMWGTGNPSLLSSMCHPSRANETAHLEEILIPKHLPYMKFD